MDFYRTEYQRPHLAVRSESQVATRLDSPEAFRPTPLSHYWSAAHSGGGTSPTHPFILRFATLCHHGGVPAYIRCAVAYQMLLMDISDSFLVRT